jgi:hypothetical protein
MLLDGVVTPAKCQVRLLIPDNSVSRVTADHRSINHRISFNEKEKYRIFFPTFEITAWLRCILINDLANARNDCPVTIPDPCGGKK